ncbi:hypothetical protein J7M00_06805 [bacterium]|nr:hypothetical protein [bacterium]
MTCKIKYEGVIIDSQTGTLNKAVEGAPSVTVYWDFDRWENATAEEVIRDPAVRRALSEYFDDCRVAGTGIIALWMAQSDGETYLMLISDDGGKVITVWRE